ncbi:similar to Saccharomyces cerevisiae YBR258C SHG1 Subunit of the COMPASS (Set1C) complex, which methylates histone H3 on lysine 4 and is required in transcriptional silencing near telomeres [Maudiozyma barnettii]|uniref:Similar to Saccharomyces cerevisiae YBR258C SHG1 Subunit of the COMPASS (Set1C) complex, which methylates histone H3 on lysine 4 and is required in transcriptional silencing near telomeres n=1 Tax=Maudiozyma barnettii TaxID=61262 RepID=A0A8H2ZI28_9SACH|nr:Shg1p [Kazachstania barnettii]CAB4254538.1 similar to Saccharomyces cerevisiae YBR258C SHG1 Subunit of the COMPASS (Set1C) complex, which methylates histone H3 on lysine 4 and is required in transcriptional silencing near telomeres [Kazachstania barnettii]CAD1782580.1 similar to Saccharomyces cerevisiae YBR258C SHG1 Subunit of the COMPASS (Set1C) complex, which methylates histone H3 on lysine 4 and is required in transcriptional silencing near telomeres [Kazachstania barnettii]
MDNSVTFDEQEAQELAEQFKKQGYLDKLKRDILSNQLEKDVGSTDPITFEDSVKEHVKLMVNKMVMEDENLIFKNRGTTTALIETKMLKDYYKMLDGGPDRIDITNYIKEKLKDQNMHNNIRQSIEHLYNEKEGSKS